MAYNFKNLVAPQNIATGIAEYALLALASWFDVNGIKAPVAPFTNQGDSIIVTTPHVFVAPNTGFMKFQLAPQKNKLDVNTVGDLGLGKFTQEAEIFIAGSYAAVHETMKNLLNQPLIVLVKDSNCEADLFYQLGCDCQFAWITGTFTTSTTKDGTKGYTCKITYDGPVQFYNVTGGPDVMV